MGAFYSLRFLESYGLGTLLENIINIYVYKTEAASAGGERRVWWFSHGQGSLHLSPTSCVTSGPRSFQVNQ